MCDLRKIIFRTDEQNPNFGYGKYGDFEIIIMKENGFVNATKLVDQSASGKRFEDWRRLVSSTNLMDKLEKHFDGKVCLLVDKVHNRLRGTYVHRKLITHISSWLSVDFALKVSDIVDQFIINEYEEKLEKCQQEVQEKNNEISELKDMMKKIIGMNNIHSNKLDDQGKLMRDQGKLMKDQAKILRRQENKLDNIAVCLDVATNRYVPPAQNIRKNEVLLLVQNPNIDEVYNIHAIRCMKTEKQRLLLLYVTAKINEYNQGKKQKIKQKSLEKYILFEVETPNSKNLWHRVKEDEELKRKLSFKCNNIYICDNDEENFTLEDLCDAITRINNKKKELYVTGMIEPPRVSNDDISDKEDDSDEYDKITQDDDEYKIEDE